MAQKAQNNEFVEKGVETLGFSKSDNDKDRLHDKKIKMDYYQIKKERPQLDLRTIILI